jgi:hypothetical protein
LGLSSVSFAASGIKKPRSVSSIFILFHGPMEAIVENYPQSESDESSSSDSFEQVDAAQQRRQRPE